MRQAEEIEDVEEKFFADQTDSFSHVRDLLKIIKIMDKRITELEKLNDAEKSYRLEQSEK